MKNTGIFETIPESDNVTVTLVYDRPDSDSEGWLNHLVLNGRCGLSMKGVDELSFRDSRSAGPGTVTRFQMGDGSECGDLGYFRSLFTFERALYNIRRCSRIHSKHRSDP